MPTNDGSFLERLVQVIEQSISPESTIQRNVQMPVLTGAKKRFAQCDIVIRRGQPPRETITIVEVQDRKKAVTINEFRGWIEKLKEIGAQHLYCVSRQPFPASIKEKAQQSGHTVKLILLQELTIDQIPLDFFKTDFYYFDVDVPYMRKVETVFPTLDPVDDKVILDALQVDLTTLTTNDPTFSFNKSQRYALSTLCIAQHAPSTEVAAQTFMLDLGYDATQPFFYYTHGKYFQLRLRLAYTYSSKKIPVPISYLSYEQYHDGTLAWVLEGAYATALGPCWVKIPVTRHGSEFKISGMFLCTPDNMEFSLAVEQSTP